MMNRLALACAVLVGGVAMLGCDAPEEDSCNIKTPGIFVEYEVTEQGASATALATFWVGDKAGGTYLTFGSCGDSATVNGQALTKVSNGDHDSYKATLTSTDAYEFVFTREGETPYSSSVTPRAAVNITAPASGTSISRADAFDLTWEANDSGSVNLLISGDCIKDFPDINGSSVSDNGKYAVNANAIEPFVSSDADKSCTAKVELKRQNSGTLSTSLKGTIDGYSIGTTSFTSAP